MLYFWKRAMVASESSEVAMDCVYSIPGKNVVLPAFSLATSGGQYHLHKRDCKGRGPLPGFGVSPKNLFPFFLLAACGGKEKKEEKLGTPQTPAGRPLHPFQDVFKVLAAGGTKGVPE